MHLLYLNNKQPLTLAIKDKSSKNILLVLTLSYTTILCISLLFGILGALVFADHVEVVVLSNLFYWPSDTVAVIVAATTILNLLSSLSFWLCIVCGMAEEALFVEPQKTKRYLLRAMYITASTVVAYVTRSDLAFMTCLSSVFVLIAEFLVPVVLFLKIFHCELTTAVKAGNYSLIVFGLVLVIMTIDKASGSLIA